MRCPNCNSPVSVTDRAGNPWYACGTTKTFRSASCVDREPLAAELRNALARIKRLEEAGDALYENSYPTRWDLPEANARKLKEQEEWLKAKEAKP